MPGSPEILDGLAPWACNPARSAGRRFPQPNSATRNEYQRDRDRIVHSTAFRRLVYKTQVFLNHEGDLFRTRLTHSIEVAQLARSIARPLRLHEDLVEAIALAHDLGHTPFGHAGQDALDACLRAWDPDSGGFEHNFQSLRVVDELEERYPQFDGLNLTFETREGILKHCSGRRARELEAVQPGGVGRRFLDRTRPSLEAQVCNLADEFAYNAHDIDDGVRSGLLDYRQLLDLAGLRHHHEAALHEHPQLSGRRLLYELLRRVLTEQVEDVVRTTRHALQEHAPYSPNDVRALPTLVRVSPSLEAEFRDVKALLKGALYRHPQVVAQTEQAKQVVRDLFRTYCADPAQMPPQHAERRPVGQAVADYIAGMTDRFAWREHARLCGGDPRLSSLGR